MKNGEKMFIGQYPSNISKTRRVAVPSKFRDGLGDKFVITKWYESCLVLVSYKGWENLVDSVLKKPEYITGSVRDTQRFIYGSAFEMAADEQGRIVIPHVLAEYAKLSQVGVFIGLGERVELWESGEWKKRERYISSHAARLLENIANKDGS